MQGRRRPNGCKDANEVLVKHGKELLRQCIREAKPCPISGIHDIQSIEVQIANLYQQGSDRGVAIGWKNMRHLLRVRPGEMTE